jgi:hypothetical protein
MFEFILIAFEGDFLHPEKCFHDNPTLRGYRGLVLFLAVIRDPQVRGALNCFLLLPGIIFYKKGCTLFVNAGLNILHCVTDPVGLFELLDIGHHIVMLTCSLLINIALSVLSSLASWK